MNKELKIGDLVTGLSPGFYEITEIKKRWKHFKFETTIISEEPTEIYNKPYNSLLNITLIYDSYGNTCKKTPTRLDEAHCNLANDIIPVMIKNYKKILKTINKKSN